MRARIVDPRFCAGSGYRTIPTGLAGIGTAATRVRRVVSRRSDEARPAAGRASILMISIDQILME
jgi:hypothetical protein